MSKEAKENVLLPEINKVLAALRSLIKEAASCPLLSLTHGQPATPTTMGKEYANFVFRLEKIKKKVEALTFCGKCNGAVGNYNAHVTAYPDFDWISHCETFVTGLGLEFNPYTTQIEPHDSLAEFFDLVSAFNTVLIGLCQDTWGYISKNYFKLRTVKDEVGSSTMPHKVNPIDFENAEGNLGMSNALLKHLSLKLPISRFQRDLSDSTVLRNIGVALGYSFLAWKSLQAGLSKLVVHEENMLEELRAHWEVLAEPIQTCMRRYSLPEPYEQLKALTRGVHGITQEAIQKFIAGSGLPEHEKERLSKLTPDSYIGEAIKLANNV